MVSSRSSHFIPGVWQPARKFPVKKWLEQRYLFRIPTPLAARWVMYTPGWATSAPREFPAKRWLRERQTHSRLEGSGGYGV